MHIWFVSANKLFIFFLIFHDPRHSNFLAGIEQNYAFKAHRSCSYTFNKAEEVQDQMKAQREKLCRINVKY
jgi:hypothetical protein